MTPDIICDAIGPREDALLTENLRLVRRIGEGAMGSVWLARHLRLDMLVAVKFMSDASSFWSTSVATQRFVQEARAAAQLRHPNVVRILDFGHAPWEGRTPYIVMEYLEGIDLERYISERGRLDVDEVVNIVLTVASVLERAHGLGIVHRDIKPGNVFLEGAARTAKVFDFGVALFANEEASCRMTQSGEMVGTPFFMSPEQFINPRQVDGKCDLWGLAVLAYEALVGSVPFRGETPTAVFLAASQGRYIAPSRLRPELPPAVDRWFRTAFAEDPARRFPSAAAMAHAFVRAVAPEDAVPKSEAAAATKARARSRSSRLSTAISAGFVLAAVAGAALLGRTNVEAAAQTNEEQSTPEDRATETSLTSAEPQIEFPAEPVRVALQPASDVHATTGHAKPSMRRHVKRPAVAVGGSSLYYLY